MRMKCDDQIKTAGTGTIRRAPKLISLSLLAFACAVASCARSPVVPPLQSVNEQIAERAGVDRQSRLVSPGVNLDDGITEHEAISLALWNNPTFRASLSDLGVAEADLFDASTFRNPTLSLLDPVGPGVLEGTIAIPVSLLRRPARVEAAELQLAKTVHSLVQNGLGLARDVRHQFAEVVTSEEKAELQRDDAAAAQSLADIAEKRAQVGRGTGMDAVAARAAALELQSHANVATDSAVTARIRLGGMIGASVNDLAIDAPVTTARLSDIPRLEELRQIAQTTRPDLIAADMGVDAARRANSGRGIDTLQPGFIVDLGQEQNADLQVSGGASVDIPVFDQGQGARLRDRAALDRALAERDALRQRIDEELSIAHSSFLSAARLYLDFENNVVPAAAHRLELTQQSFELGRASLNDLLLAQRAYISVRLRQVDAKASMMRAIADINYSAGRELFTTNTEREAS
jgi:cobalt-zinc-cadmium efflux system outer membrane protein